MFKSIRKRYTKAFFQLANSMLTKETDPPLPVQYAIVDSNPNFCPNSIALESNSIPRVLIKVGK